MENKTGKYFKYAIGEIILVVIGILIALSINNWNEGKKRTAQEVKILKEIKSELEDALIDLTSDIEDHQRNQNSSIIIGDAILNKQKYHDSLNEHFLLLIDTEDWLAKRSAFESLQSLGLELITNDSLREKITTTYMFMEVMTGEETSANKSARKLENILESHIVIDRQELISRSEDRWFRGIRNYPFTIANYEALLNDEQFLHNVLLVIRDRGVQIYGNEFFKDGIEEVINDIDQDLIRLE
jgi:hypothetical protein